MMSEDPKPINLLKTEYKLLGKIGSGGFSFVYLVENISSGVLRAAKGTSQPRNQLRILTRTKNVTHLHLQITITFYPTIPKTYNYLSISITIDTHLSKCDFITGAGRTNWVLI